MLSGTIKEENCRRPGHLGLSFMHSTLHLLDRVLRRHSTEPLAGNSLFEFVCRPVKAGPVIGEVKTPADMFEGNWCRLLGKMNHKQSEWPEAYAWVATYKKGAKELSDVFGLLGRETAGLRRRWIRGTWEGFTELSAIDSITHSLAQLLCFSFLTLSPMPNLEGSTVHPLIRCGQAYPVTRNLKESRLEKMEILRSPQSSTRLWFRPLDLIFEVFWSHAIWVCSKTYQAKHDIRNL